MKGYKVSAPIRAIGALVGVVALLLATMGPADAQNRNLTANAKYIASSYWEEDADPPNPGYTPAKAFDGNLSTRWNSRGGDGENSWLGATWDQPVTINKVVIREAYHRFVGFHLQIMEPGTDVWKDAYVAEDAAFNVVRLGDPENPTFSIRLPNVKAIGLRVLFNQVISTSMTIFEVEAYGNPSGTVQGTVRDDKGNPVAGAVVRVGDDRVLSDANGKYALITDVGSPNVEAEKPGAFRRKVVRGVAVAVDTATALDFALTPQPNLSFQAKAASSSNSDDDTASAAKANDGDRYSRWISGEQDGSWLEMEWTQPQTFTKTVIREGSDNIRNYTLQRWDASTSNYVDIVTNVAVPKQGGHPILSNVFAQPVTTTRLRLLVVTAENTPSVWEFEATNAATATVKGVVKDAVSGQAVSKATVQTDLGDIVTTDDKGVFTLVVEADEYIVRATADGYFRSGAAPLNLQAGDSQEITLQVAPPGPNLAKEGKPIFSSEDPSSPASAINDGDLDTYWLTETDAASGQYVGLEFTNPITFTVAQVRGVQTLVQNSLLQVLAEDGKTWVDLPNTRFNVEFQGANQDFFFPDRPITTKAVRWLVIQVHSPGNIPGLSELLLYNAPIQP
jgi:hypothetical protein